MVEDIVSNLEGLGYRGATVVLTGGASGMGEAAARILDEWGAKVHIADITEPTVAHASFTKLDLSDFDAVRAACAKLHDDLGTIDYLFPIAGIPPHALGALTAMAVNYIGTRLFTEELAPAMNSGGAIGLVASTAGRYWQKFLDEHLETLKLSPEDARAWFAANPDKLRDGYSPSKELLIVWIQQAAITLAEQHRVRINCVAPCPIATPFMEATAGVLGQGFIDNYPFPLLGRMASAQEQALSLLMLSSPLNAAVTGATLFADQGYAGGLVTGALQPAARPAVTTPAR